MKRFFYYVDPTTTSNAMNVFLGGKERVRIPLSGKHCSLQAFVKHVVEHEDLRKEAQKRGLGCRIDISLRPGYFSPYVLAFLLYTSRERSFPSSTSPDDVETTASDIQPHGQQYGGSSDVSDDSEQVQVIQILM